MLKRLYIEITDHCNLKCPFCISNSNNNYLSLEAFKHIIKEIKPYCNYVYLHVLGEPTSHPYFDDFLTILDENNINLQLVTNGTLLNKHKRLLQHPCLRKLSISIHSVDKLNIGEQYFKTINNLINKVQNTKCNLELRFYDYHNLNGGSLDYLNMLKKQYKLIATTKKDSYKLCDNVYIYIQKLFRWPNINDEIIGETGSCHGGKNMLAILSNGDVSLCCLDAFGHTKIGNIHQESFKEILNNNIYLLHLNNLKQHKLTFELCKKCTYRLRFK
ncbi:MAG: SPASM domain-containing protein [Erysipelotrichaceae bacterium]|nr:SPASM domain-containing protein [Erysipelotrichaceae bacterium]